jgi:hypothetical protein
MKITSFHYYPIPFFPDECSLACSFTLDEGDDLIDVTVKIKEAIKLVNPQRNAIANAKRIVSDTENNSPARVKEMQVFLDKVEEARKFLNPQAAAQIETKSGIPETITAQ